MAKPNKHDSRNYRLHNNLYRAALLGLAPWMFANTGSAAEDGRANSSIEDVIFEEIIVTATKRSESLQDVALAISALTTKDINQQGLDGFQDYAQRIPGVTLTQVAKNGAEFRMRGLSSNILSIYGSFNQDPVSVYIDDVPVVGAVNALLRPDLRLYDIERIEVLRGPQGTLFGSGSLGGAVRIITKKPELDTFDTSFLTDFGQINGGSLRQRYNGMVNVPLMEDKLALRAVAYYRDEEGYIDNIGRGIDNADSSKDWGARVAVKAALTDRFIAVASFLHQDSRPEENSTFDPTLGEHKRFTRYEEHKSSQITSYNLNLEYEFDSASLVSTTTLFNTEGESNVDVTPFVGVIGVYEPIDLDGQFISQELRLSSTGAQQWDWIVGAFYIDRETHWQGGHFAPDIAEELPAITIAGLGANGQFDYFDSDRDSREIAAFGEVTYHINEQFDLTGGWRYSEIKTMVGNHGSEGVASLIPLVFTPMSGTVTQIQHDDELPVSDSVWTGKASLSYRPNADQTFYLLVSRGYRIGMANLTSGPDPANPEAFVIPKQFEPDSLWNYELGAKLVMLGGRLTANLAAYYVPWKDIQLQGRRYTDFANFVANAGEAVSKGIEMEFKYIPTENWELGLTVTRQKARITEMSAEESLITGAVEGDHMPGSPDFQLAGSIQYSWVFGDGKMYVRADAQYTGESENGLTNAGGTGLPNPALGTNAAYENVNASLGYNDNRWWVSFYLENLTDNDDLILVQDTISTFNRFATLRPRTAGLRFSWNY